MFSYKSQPIGAELLQSNKEEEEDVVRLLRAKEAEKNSDEDPADIENLDREVRKMQDMDINAQKVRKELEKRGVDEENEYIEKVWEETARDAAELIKHKFSTKI